MIDIRELRIGNVVFNTDTKTNIIVKGITQDFIINENDEEIQLTIIEPLYLDEISTKLLNQRILIERDGLYYFTTTATYFLVFDKNKGNFFIGMIDTDLPENHRRITKPFLEFHKLQNAYFTITNKELKKII